MIFLEKYEYIYIFPSYHFFRIPQAVKFAQTETFPKSLLTASRRILEDSISRTGHNLRPTFGTEGLGLNRWICKFYSINMLNPRLICTRNFSSFKNSHRNILSRHRTFGWTHEQLRKQFLKRSSMASSPPSCLSPLKALKRVQEAPKRLLKSQRNKTHKTSIYRGPCYPICLHKVRWRGFHSSLFPLAKSDSDKSGKICKASEVKKTDEYDESYKERREVCRPEKVKCDKSQRNKEKKKQKPETEKKAPACKKTCLPIGKCDLPRTVPPPKMEYAKVTCPPPKFIKPKPCPPVEHFRKDDTSDMETRQAFNVRKKQICAPPPLPKPPYAPIVLCPCPPPPKVHPGPCPQYEINDSLKRPKMQPCRLKKKYPCPTGVFYCPPQKKPCNLKQETGCQRRKKKKTSANNV